MLTTNYLQYIRKSFNILKLYRSVYKNTTSLLSFPLMNAKNQRSNIPFTRFFTIHFPLINFYSSIDNHQFPIPSGVISGGNKSIVRSSRMISVKRLPLSFPLISRSLSLQVQHQVSAILLPISLFDFNQCWCFRFQ